MGARKVYRYHFKVGDRVVFSGFTIDLKRRESEHRRRWPRGHIEQVGQATTRQDAWKWEKLQNEQSLSSAS